MNKLLDIELISPQKKALRYLFHQKIDNYEASITFLTNYQWKKFRERCIEEKIYEKYSLRVNYKGYDALNKSPYIIFLTKKRAKDNIKAIKEKKKITFVFSAYHFKKVCRPTLNSNHQFEDLLNNIYQNPAVDDPGIYMLPKVDYWSLKPSKDVKLYQKPSKKTIPLGMKPKNLKDFFEKFIKKDKIENYYPYPIYLDEANLIKYLKYITKIKKVENKLGKKKLIKNKKTLELRFKKSFFFPSKVFIFYLTKTQIKKIKKDRRPESIIFPSILEFSNNQLIKTYKEVTKVNSEIYKYLKYRKVDRFYENDKNKTFQPKKLAITDSSFNENIKNLESLNFQEKDLIDFEDEKDLIDFGNEEAKDLVDFGNEEAKDLIDLNTIIPPKNPTAQELLMDEELFPKGKKYKVRQDEDLIPTRTTPSTDGVNILKNILNFPETKRILGISLTADLK